MIDVIVFFIVLLYCWLFSSLCCCDFGYIILLESYTVWKILCSQNFFQVLPVFRDLWDKVPSTLKVSIRGTYCSLVWIDILQVCVPFNKN